MTQAVWSLANGHGFTVTDPAGEQISRLGAHVEPILLAFVPFWKVWPDPRMLMIVQALAVATIAIPTYLLARHWLDDRVTSVAFAAVSLMLPAVQWATLFDFHPVTLAAPLLMWAIRAAVTGRILVLVVCAGAALMTKEQVGLAVAILGVWIAVRLGRRLVGWVLAATSLAWTAIAVSVIVPYFRDGAASPFIEERYGDLGSSASEVVWSIVTRPWDAAAQAMSVDRFAYMAATLLPLIVLGAFAPLLAAGALPDLVLNLLSSSNEQHSIEYHYGAVIAPFPSCRSHPGMRDAASPGARLGAPLSGNSPSFGRSARRHRSHRWLAVRSASVLAVPARGIQSQERGVHRHATQRAPRRGGPPDSTGGAGVRGQPDRWAPVGAATHPHFPGDRGRPVRGRRYGATGRG